MTNATAKTPKPPPPPPATKLPRAEFAALIESPGARAHLAANGILTLADARAMGLEKILAIPDIGDGTVEILRQALEASPAAPPKAAARPNEKAVEEGMHPVLLHSPHAAYRFPLKKAKRLFEPSSGTSILQMPLWVEFEDHTARITAMAWFMRLHDGDEDKSRAAVEAKTPWRVACVAWLRARNGFPRDFAILGD